MDSQTNKQIDNKDYDELSKSPLCGNNVYLLKLQLLLNHSVKSSTFCIITEV